MRITLFFLALALAGCVAGITNIASTSGKAVASADYLYASSSKAGEALVLSGVLDKAKYKAADAKAYSILRAVRAGTATVDQLDASVGAMLDTKETGK